MIQAKIHQIRQNPARGEPKPLQVGFRVPYRAGASCPACGGKSWHIGRSTAECAREVKRGGVKVYCGFPLPLSSQQQKHEWSDEI